MFASQWFFDPARQRVLIKSPLDLVVGSLRSLAATVKWPAAAKVSADLGQDVFAPPSVKGWEGVERLWINSSTILLRTNFATELASGEQLATLLNSVVEGSDGSSEMVVAKLERLLLGDEVDPSLHAEIVLHHQRAEGGPLRRSCSTCCN